jgi:hypothetical protein
MASLGPMWGGADAANRDSTVLAVATSSRRSFRLHLGAIARVIDQVAQSLRNFIDRWVRHPRRSRSRHLTFRRF